MPLLKRLGIEAASFFFFFTLLTDLALLHVSARKWPRTRSAL